MDKKIYYWSVISFLILSIILCIDITLINWYESFYQSINQKNQSQFFYSIIKFILISGSNALALSTLSYVLELLDLELKLVLSTFSVKKIGTNKSHHETNQKPIDDATLAAERLSSTLPMFAFNSIKILVLISLIFLWSPDLLYIKSLGINIPYPLLITSIIFISIQTVIAKQYFPLLQRTDRLKRKTENKFRLTLLGLTDTQNINNGLKTYLKAINAIRKHTALKNFTLSVTLGLISTFSYVVPYIALFQFYINDALNFGEIMKLSATFSIFINSCTYIMNNSRELFRGFAALSRVLN